MHKPIHLQLLSRHQCCLCEDAKLILTCLASEGLCTWETVDVDHDKTLLIRYGMHVPVLLMADNELFRHKVTETALRPTLTELTDE